MAANYNPNWEDEDSQCQKCRNYREQDGQYVCVPQGKSFEAALEEWGEISPTGHCDYFKEW